MRLLVGPGVLGAPLLGTHPPVVTCRVPSVSVLTRPSSYKDTSHYIGTLSTPVPLILTDMTELARARTF